VLRPRDTLPDSSRQGWTQFKAIGFLVSQMATLSVGAEGRLDVQLSGAQTLGASYHVGRNKDG
jgi:hypothetical protein